MQLNRTRQLSSHSTSQHAGRQAHLMAHASSTSGADPQPGVAKADRRSSATEADGSIDRPTFTDLNIIQQPNFGELTNKVTTTKLADQAE